MARNPRQEQKPNDYDIRDDYDDRILRADCKLAALSHLFSQYDGELEFPDVSAHGLAWLLDDIRDTLKPSPAKRS